MRNSGACPRALHSQPHETRVAATDHRSLGKTRPGVDDGDGRSPGFRVITGSRAFPRLAPQWLLRVGSPVTVAGPAAASDHIGLFCVPFSPPSRADHHGTAAFKRIHLEGASAKIFAPQKGGPVWQGGGQTGPGLAGEASLGATWGASPGRELGKV